MEIHDNDIAIIGMEGVFPCSNTLDNYWDLLINQKCALKKFTREELLSAGLRETLIDNINYIPVKGAIDDYSEFDASYFRITKSEEASLNINYKLLLTLCDKLLRTSGYNWMDSKESNIGVFASCNNPTENNIPFTTQNFNQHLFSQPNFLPMYISYKLNLTGPAVFIQTACSSALVSIITACENIKSGFCYMAIAGGSSTQPQQISGYMFEDGFIYSKNGSCHPFSKMASGVVPGNGGGVVLLKKLKDAVKDRDNIHAVIKGYHINNDGSDKLSFSAPGFKGQAELISKAIQRSHLNANQISYIEAHGTGTTIGDQIEVEALKSIFTDSHCYIGSVKSSIGHTDIAAGIASLIKVALSFEHGYMPPMHIPLAENSFDKEELGDNLKILKNNIVWNEVLESRRYAGVSAFGIGGTNAHIILGQHHEFLSRHKSYSVGMSRKSGKSNGGHIVQNSEGNDLLKEIKTICHLFFNNPDMNESDDITDYGLDSLSSLELASSIFRNTGITIAPQELSSLQSISSIANHISSKITNKPKLIEIQSGCDQLPPLVLIHPGHGFVDCYSKLTNQLNIKNGVYAIENNIFNDLNRHKQTIEEMAEDYCDIVKHQLVNNHNIILGGWSFGGNVSVEMAKRLTGNINVKELILFDSWATHDSRFSDKDSFESLFDKKINIYPELSYIKKWIDLHWNRANILYAHKPNYKLKTPCLLIKAELLDEEYGSINDNVNHWGNVFELPLTIEKTKSYHSTMFDNNNIVQLSQILTKHLDSSNE